MLNRSFLYLSPFSCCCRGVQRRLRPAISDTENEPKMLSDEQYVGKKVEVIGKYPAQEAFCRALLCTCEDYILVNQIQISQ
jgi:hypothetical protein